MSAPVVGLTGILGSGKSAAAAFFADHGAHIVDMDEAGRWAVDNLPEVHQQIKSKFGSGLFDEHNHLLRRKLGDIVFADDKALASLNAIVHPAMLRRVRDLVLQAQQTESAPYIIVDAALIFELHFDRECDLTLVVTSPLEFCLQRAAATKGLSRAQAQARIESQMPQQEKAARADIVIANESSLDDLSEKVKGAHLLIMQKL